MVNHIVILSLKKFGVAQYTNVNYSYENESNLEELLGFYQINLLGYAFMVAEMLQKSKLLLYVLYSCYMKFYFCYIFHIYVICVNILYIYILSCFIVLLYIICFLILLYISIFALFDLKFVWSRFYFHYMYKIVIM